MATEIISRSAPTTEYRNCYAQRIHTDACAPRCRRGEWVLVDPDKGLKAGCEVLTTLKTGEVLVHEFDPTINRGDVESIHAVFGRADYLDGDADG